MASDSESSVPVVPMFLSLLDTNEFTLASDSESSVPVVPMFLSLLDTNE